MKIEIGGGTNPVDDTFINVDRVESADVKHDLDTYPWPLADDVAHEVYSSHCIEHLENPLAALSEIARISNVGANVVIKLPDPLSDSSMCPGHKHSIGEVWMRNNLEHFAKECWPRKDKILQIKNIHRECDPTWFWRARESPLFARYTDQEILAWVPRTCHETVFQFEVVSL